MSRSVCVVVFISIHFLDINDILGGRCWNRSNYRVWDRFSTRRPTRHLPRILFAFPSLVFSILRIYIDSVTSVCWFCMLSRDVFAWGDVCVHSSQTRLRWLCHAFYRSCCRVCSWIQLSNEGISFPLVTSLLSSTCDRFFAVFNCYPE
jgi:hypothetical protein